MVNKERVELFAQALEGEGYTQCHGVLQHFALDGKELNCALGVAVHVALNNGLWRRMVNWKDYLFQSGTLEACIQDWYGFPDETVSVVDEYGEFTCVSEMNDTGHDFWTIAQAVRATYLKDEG